MTGTASSVSCPRGIRFKWFKCNNNSLYFYLQYISLTPYKQSSLFLSSVYTVSLSPYINNLLSVSTPFHSLFHVLFRFGMGRSLRHVLSFNPVYTYSMELVYLYVLVDCTLGSVQHLSFFAHWSEQGLSCFRFSNFEFLFSQTPDNITFVYCTIEAIDFNRSIIGILRQC